MFENFRDGRWIFDGGDDVQGRTNSSGARLHGCTIPWMEEVERRRERAAEEVGRSIEPEPMAAQES